MSHLTLSARILTLLAILVAVGLPQASSARMTPVELELALFDCGNDVQEACIAAWSSSLDLAYLVNLETQSQLVQARLVSKRSECLDGQVHSCTDLGVLLSISQPNDNAEAYGLFTSGCDKGDGWACNLLNQVTHNVQRNAGGNFNIFYAEQERLCTEGSAGACATQARLNVLLQDSVPDKKIWYDQLVFACDRDISRACVNLSYLMSDEGQEEYRNFDIGKSLLASFTKRSSLAYAKKACDLGNPVGCWNAGLAYSDGIGARADWSAAQTFFVKACAGGFYTSCSELNYDIYWRDTDSDKVLKNACTNSDFTACLVLEQRRYRTLDKSVDPKERQTLQANHLANLIEICSASSWIACANVAVISRRLGNSMKAEKFATIACNREISEACFVLGNVWKFDRVSQGHHQKAVHYLQRACDLGSRGACNNLGDSYRKGLGVTVNANRAKRYFSIACDKELRIACKNLQSVTSSK